MRPEAPAWARAYIGIPFVDHGRTMEGADCGGLARLIWQRECGFTVRDHHDYSGTDMQDLPQIERIIAAERESGDWLHIPFDRDAPQRAWPERAFDAIEIRIVGLPTHIGVVCCPGIAIHTMKARQDSVLLRYRDPEYRHVVLGFHRHKSLA